MGHKRTNVLTQRGLRMRRSLLICLTLTLSVYCQAASSTPDECSARCGEANRNEASVCSEVLQSNRSCSGFLEEHYRICLKGCAARDRKIKAKPDKVAPGGCNADHTLCF